MVTNASTNDDYDANLLMNLEEDDQSFTSDEMAVNILNKLNISDAISCLYSSNGGCVLYEIL
jgi:hypothetical protein